MSTLQTNENKHIDLLPTKLDSKQFWRKKHLLKILQMMATPIVNLKHVNMFGYVEYLDI